MHVKGRSREIDPQVIAALAVLVLIAITGAVAWPIRKPFTDLLKQFNFDLLTPFEFLSAWGALMVVVALIATMVDGGIALVADIKGRGNRSPAARQPQRTGLNGVLRSAMFWDRFTIFSWCGAAVLFGIGILLHLYTP